MEGRLNTFDTKDSLDKLTEEESGLLAQIEDRYRTAEGISETLIDQVKVDFDNLYDMYDNVPRADNINKEKIKHLLDHMKDIYPDVILGNKDADLESSLFTEKDIENDLETIN